MRFMETIAVVIVGVVGVAEAPLETKSFEKIRLELVLRFPS